MRTSVRVSLVQLSCEPLNREVNAERMAAHVKHEAVEHGADLVVFPELASTGYLPETVDSDFSTAILEQAEPIPGPTSDLLAQAAGAHDVHVIAGIAELPKQPGTALDNSAVFVGPDGDLIGVYRKTHAPPDERAVFRCGNEVSVFDCDLGRLAINICYDVRFAELARAQALDGAEILVSIWAMYDQPGMAPDDSISVRCRSRAMENFIYALGCNRTGGEHGRTFSGGSVVAAPSGAVLASADPTRSETVLRATLTNEAFERQRGYLPIFEDRRPDLYSTLAKETR